MRIPHLFLGVCTLLFAACSAKEILVTDPIQLDVKIDGVNSTKFAFTVTPSNQDAHYSFCVLSSLNQDYYLTPEEQVKNFLKGEKESYNIKKESQVIKESSLVDYTCYRGTRQLISDKHTFNTDFKLLVFQVNPTNFEVIGDIQMEIVHTSAVTLRDFPLKISFKDGIMTIVPPDETTTYFWTFDRTSRVMDNYIWAFGFYYDLVTMYEDYGFMDNVLVIGPQEHSLSRDNMWEDESYTFMGTSYEDDNITSNATIIEFIYHSDREIEVKESYIQGDNN